MHIANARRKCVLSLAAEVCDTQTCVIFIYDNGFNDLQCVSLNARRKVKTHKGMLSSFITGASLTRIACHKGTS